MTTLRRGRDLDGRLVAAAIVAAYLVVVATCRVVFDADPWPSLGVPSGPSLFFDARNVAAASECRELGYDPLVDNPCDPWGRTIVYPRIWTALGGLGLRQSHTDVFAVVALALLGVALWTLVGRTTVRRGVVLGLAAVSPAAMFAVERANMDVVIVAALAAAALVWRRPRIGWWSGPALVLAAAVAKLYPAAALPAFVVTRDRRAVVAAGAALAAFGVYGLVIADDLRVLADTNPQGEHHSFGARILLARLLHAFGPDRWQGSLGAKQLLVLLPLAAVAAALVPRLRRRLHGTLPPADDAAHLVAFHLGALVYLGNFALGNSYDYRLVVLLLLLPQLLAWRSAGDATTRRLVDATTATAVVLLYVSALSRPLATGDEVVSWLLAGLLVAVLAASVPSLLDRRRPAAQ